MATIHLCDKCKEEVECKDDLYIVGILSPATIFDTHFIRDGFGELCEDCVQSVRSWVNCMQKQEDSNA